MIRLQYFLTQFEKLRREGHKQSSQDIWHQTREEWQKLGTAQRDGNKPNRTAQFHGDASRYNKVTLPSSLLPPSRRIRTAFANVERGYVRRAMSSNPVLRFSCVMLILRRLKVTFRFDRYLSIPCNPVIRWLFFPIRTSTNWHIS